MLSGRQREDQRTAILAAVACFVPLLVARHRAGRARWQTSYHRPSNSAEIPSFQDMFPMDHHRSHWDHTSEEKRVSELKDLAREVQEGVALSSPDHWPVSVRVQAKPHGQARSRTSHDRWRKCSQVLAVKYCGIEPSLVVERVLDD